MPKPKREFQMGKPKRSPGRPPRPMSPRIDATPDGIADVILNTPPPKKWRYLQEAEKAVDAS